LVTDSTHSYLVLVKQKEEAMLVEQIIKENISPDSFVEKQIAFVAEDFAY